ncbi:testicular acid phosphatase homolog [Battus philenor]|uniref:testicular acid phosphatase homolog n=1 Tax=Battus philenor TaxID=42288 RepID=UPI0035D05CD6
MFLIFALLNCSFCYSYILSEVKGDADGKLVQVHVVFRHGHREPKSFYPYDPHAFSNIWTNGPTQLTILGRQQAYRLGQQLRNRYKSLLPRVRAWKAIKATSSDTSRTLMTTAAVLAGLIPPYTEDIWSNITWQPAAIHTSPPEIDNILGPHPYCPRYDHLLNNLPNKSDNEKRLLYHLLSMYTGKHISSSNSLVNLYTCLDIESQAGFKLPSWTKPIYRKLTNYTIKALMRLTQTLELKRLRSGPLIKKITSYHKSKSYNIHLYCTHDSVLSGLIGSLGFDLIEPPSFTSALIVEYRIHAGEVTVQFFYRKGPVGELTRLKLPGCSDRCYLRQLKSIVHKLIPYNWSEDCAITYENNLESELQMVLAIITLIVLIGWCFIHKYTESYGEL